MKTIRLNLKTAKPRNPLVAAMRSRHGGRHQPGGGAARLRGRALLRRELAQLEHPPHSP